MNDPYPVPQVGRRGMGLTTADWQNLAGAYDTWNEHLTVCNDLNQEPDPDLKAFVKDVFDDVGLWDHNNDEPNIEQYRIMFRTVC